MALAFGFKVDIFVHFGRKLFLFIDQVRASSAAAEWLRGTFLCFDFEEIHGLDYLDLLVVLEGRHLGCSRGPEREEAGAQRKEALVWAQMEFKGVKAALVAELC